MALTLVPACVFYAGQMSSGAMKQWLLAGTVLWFVSETWRNKVKGRRQG